MAVQREHIMLDLETVSTEYNARIIAIGAVKFDQSRRIYSSFYQPVEIDTLDAMLQHYIHDVVDSLGFHISKQTLLWWNEQEAAAKTVFTDPNAMTIHKALKAFSSWATKDTPLGDICVWGNGASFDNVILSTAYTKCNLQRPWKFYNDRCYRTVKNLYPNVSFKRLGTYHNALNDAESQAEHLLAMNINLERD